METTSENVSFDEIILQFHRPIYKYCYHMLRHHQDSENAAQEVFLKAFRHIDHPENTSAGLSV